MGFSSGGSNFQEEQHPRQQVTRPVRQYRSRGCLCKHYQTPAHGFARKFTAADRALLAETDRVHGTLSGSATKRLLQRAFEVFWDRRYCTVGYPLGLASVQPAGVCRLPRATHALEQDPWESGAHRRKASARARRAPGFIRIDSVHQGDQDGLKGIYHINAVDCVTQWEFVACCERISEAYLLPVIEALLRGFPFVIRGFHADNGSECVNHWVAELLEKLRIEFSKSRPRHSNDNALVETKNGAVVRKHFGYSHIPQRFAPEVNVFC